MKLKLLLSVLFFALTFSAMSAQTLRLTTATGDLGVDTVQANAPITTFYDVINLDTIPYSGTFLMMAEINGDTANQVIFDSITVNILNQGDTTNFPSTLVASLNEFDGGVNIVVVWPAALSPGVGFVALTDTIFVDTTEMTHLAPALKAQHVKIYPVPTHTRVKIELGEGAPVPASLRVMDAAGREVYFTENAFDNLDVSALKAGVYFIRMEFLNGQKYHAKIVKY